MPTIGTLEALVELVESLTAQGQQAFVRYSRGPAADRRAQGSTNHQTGRREAGLSCNPLAPPAWWMANGRDARGYVALSVRDYAYLRQQGGRGTRAWVLVGREVGRGSDNEPLVAEWRPVAGLHNEVVEAACRE